MTCCKEPYVHAKHYQDQRDRKEVTLRCKHNIKKFDLDTKMLSMDHMQKKTGYPYLNHASLIKGYKYSETCIIHFVKLKQSMFCKKSLVLLLDGLRSSTVLECNDVNIEI
jgi:hypothetical protein